jgi:hypothetical protein
MESILPDFYQKLQKDRLSTKFMNKKLSAISIIAGISLLAGMTFAFSEETILSSSEISPMSERSFMTGHITLAVYDEFGNLKSYQQTDNNIVNEGESCIGEYLFGAASNCTYTGQDFDNVLLGTGSPVGTASRGTVSAMVTPALTGTAAAVAITQTSSNADPNNLDSKEIVTITKTFSPSATDTFTEVALSNDAGADILAYQALGDATINGGADSLTVTWTITIG